MEERYESKDIKRESNEFRKERIEERHELREIERERAEFKNLIIENPNYFGTLPEVEIKPVKPMKANTKYEELKCIGFYPEQDLLEAIFDIKLPYGYKGNLCSKGSFEYVRFFIDWNGDGKFEDVGIGRVNVHDIPDKKGTCLDETKPLSYVVTIKIDSKKKICTIPHLVKVRAILSWEVPPPTGNPNYVPPWGNILDKWIQIKPTIIFLKDIIKFIDLEELKLEPKMLNLEMPISKEKMLKTQELKEIYKDKDVPEHRFNFEKFSLMAKKIKQDPNLVVKYKLDPKLSKVLENINIVLAEKSNTKYEELNCVGLNYDIDTLVATLKVKLPYGYCGNLCSKGSHEYVSFWVYIWDQIEQMCYWKYLGTSNVNVHDISNIPSEGLQYVVKLPFDLSNYKDKCSKPKVLKVRAILSWNTKPPTNDPYYNPVWGNKIDTQIQIKPIDEPIEPDERKPFIWAVGEMVVESISGNIYTITPSTIGDGFANGPSIGGGYIALESPFGGKIKISGTITNAPNNPAPDEKLKYKVQYRKVGGTWRDITDDFRIWQRIDGVPSGYINQVADIEGYFKYHKDLKPLKIVEIQDDVLTIWKTPVSGGDGLYYIRVLLYQKGTSIPGCPPDHVCSNIVKVMIDNTKPTAKVSLDAGPCTKFKVGDKITGKFTSTDKHIWKYSLTVLPTVPNPPAITPSGEVYPTLPSPGRINKKFELTTTKNTTPCGYVVRLWVWDRTIVNNHMQGNRKPADVGLCLLEKKKK